MRSLLPLLALALVPSCDTDAPTPASRNAPLALEPCQLSAPGSPVRVPARCGSMRVAEDRSAASGRRIALRVAVVPALSRTPEPDPLFFLTGGPGQAATESYVGVHVAFRRIHKDRDIVLVDQRGTGGSHALRCPSDRPIDALIFDESEAAPFVTSCLESLDADPRLYTTSVAVEDLDDVREALGYERVNLYGVSYGTRVALSYLRRHTERVRTAVLDGVVPPDEALGLDVARDAQRALETLIARCGRSVDCRARFSDLGAALDRLVSRLAQPVSLAMRHPRTGAPVTIELDRAKAAYALRLLSYAPETSSLIPLLLDSAAAGELEPLAAQYLMTAGQVAESLSDGMSLSVICSEDFPVLDVEEAEARSRDTYLGALQTENLRLVCPLWPRGEVPADFREPVRAEVPVLLLSGEVDPVTPPENAEAVARHLDVSLHVVAPGQGHVVIHRGCLPELAARFVAAGSLDRLDRECASRIEPPAFFVDFTGPAP